MFIILPISIRKTKKIILTQDLFLGARAFSVLTEGQDAQHP
jgi:hypothetical protein